MEVKLIKLIDNKTSELITLYETPLEIEKLFSQYSDIMVTNMFQYNDFIYNIDEVALISEKGFLTIEIYVSFEIMVDDL